MIGAGLVQHLVYFLELMACVFNHIAFFLHTNEVHNASFLCLRLCCSKISAIALLTNVEEYISDGEGHHVVGYDDDFSLADNELNVHEFVKQALKIEVQRLDSQAKDRVARAMIARFER